MAYYTGAAAAAIITLSPFARTLLDDADQATALATLGAQAAGSYQPLDSDLTAIAALTSAADKLPYSTGAAAWALTNLTAFARTLLDDADAATALATLTAAPLAGAAFTGAVSAIALTANAGNIAVDRIGDLADANVNIYSDNTFSSQLQFRCTSAAAAGQRWAMGKNATNEAGSNAGSDFYLQAFSDIGANVGIVFTIARATRITTFNVSPVVPTPSASDSTTKVATTQFVLGTANTYSAAQTYRIDGAALNTISTWANASVNAAAQGVELDYQLGSTLVNAWRVRILSLDTFAAAGNQTAKVEMATIKAGTLATSLILLPDGVMASRLFVSGNNTAQTSINTAGNVSYTQAQVMAGEIVRDPNGAARTDTLPTAAALVAAIPGCTVHMRIKVLIINGADAAETITLQVPAGGGGTWDANQTAASRVIPQNTQKLITMRLTNVTSGTEAYDVFG